MSDPFHPFYRPRFRKSYGYDRAPRADVTITEDGVTGVIDQNTFFVHRDFYILQHSNAAPKVFGEYDENNIAFTGQDTLSVGFNISFSSPPIVTLEVDSDNSGSNVVAYLLSVTETSVSVGLSAPLSGNVRYRAIYSPTYPTFVRRSVFSTSLEYTASAGQTLLSSMDAFTASYAGLDLFSPITPTRVWFTPYDASALNDVDVAVVASSAYGVTSTSGDLSAPISSVINFMAVA